MPATLRSGLQLVGVTVGKSLDYRPLEGFGPPGARARLP